MYSYSNKNTDLATLLLANTAAVAAFLFYGGSIAQALWVYWLQSVIIGMLHVVRVLRHKGPIVSTNKIKVNGRPLSASADVMAGPAVNATYALFFAFHYGIFHLVYAIFLGVFSAGPTPYTINGNPAGDIDLTGAGVSILAVLLNGALFAWHHFLSYVHTEQEERYKPLDFAKPYARIMPMHLVIIFGPMVIYLTKSPAYVFAFFMMLKTFADIALYNKKVSHALKPSSNK